MGEVFECVVFNERHQFLYQGPHLLHETRWLLVCYPLMIPWGYPIIVCKFEPRRITLMKLLPVVGLFFLSLMSLQAGNLDSLRQVLAQRQGAGRLPVLLQLCDLEMRTLLPAEESLQYAEELARIATATRDTAACVEAFLCAASKQDRSAGKAATEVWLAKAEHLARYRPADLAKVLFWKGNFLMESGLADSAKLVFQKGIRLCVKHRLPAMDHVKLLGATAKLFSRQNEPRMADSLGRRAIQLCSSPADSAEALRYWGGIQEDLGRPDQALRAYLRAYELEKQLGGSIIASYNLRQAAGILRNQGQYKRAIQYFEESLALAQRINYPLGIASAWHSLGGLYQEIGEYQQALHYYKLALSLKRELGRPKKILTTIRDMAELYYLSEQYDSSLAVCQRYLPMSQELNYHESESHLAFLASMSASKLGNAGLARTYLKQGEASILRVSTPEERPQILKLAAQSHALLGQHNQAYQYQVQFQEAQDSIYTLEKSRIISEMETRFDTERKEQQIIDLGEENELKNARIAADRARQQGLLISLLLFGALAFVLYRNVLARQRNNLVLEEANLELTRKNYEVQTLLREIHHRVKNNLQIISSLLRLQARKISDENVLEALRSGQARVSSMALLHQRLYQGDELKNIPMKSYLTDLTQSLLDVYKIHDSHISLHTDLDDLALDVDTAVPIGLIVNELVTNAIKYAFPDQRQGTIQLSLKQNGNDLHIQVADDGVGIALVDGKPTVSRTSFGLELVTALVQKLNGQLYFFNGMGTRTEMIVPNFAATEMIQP